MKRTSIVMLAVIAVVLAIGAYVATENRTDALSVERETAVLLPGISEKLASVDRVVIERAAETITLAKKDNGRWGVEEKGGYWADTDKLQKIFVGLGDFHPIEPRTANPEWHARLGVDGPGEDNPRTALLRLEAGGTEVASLIVGNVKSGFGATQERYVRVPGDQRAWLVRTPLAADGAVDTFLERNILAIDPERIRSITIERWDDDDVAIERPSREQTNYALATLPPGSRVKNAAELTGIARAFQTITLEDVRPAADAPDGLTSETLVTVRTFDGLAVAMNVRTGDGPAYYANITAAFDPALRAGEVNATGESDPESESESKAEGEGLMPAAAVEEEVRKLNERLDGWLFKIPQWKASSFFKANSALIEPKPEETLSVEGLLNPPADTTEQE